MQLDARFVRAYARASPAARIAALARMIVEGVEGEQILRGISRLIAVVVTMATAAGPIMQTAVSAQLREEADRLDALHDRRRLH